MVAKEIRGLADRSKASTTDISEVLKSSAVRLSQAENMLEDYGQVQEDVLENISATSRSLFDSTAQLEIINSEISSINMMVGRQSESLSNLLSSLDRINSTGAFTISNYPYIKRAIESYNGTMKGTGAAMKTLEDLLSNEQNSGSASVDSRILNVGHDIAYPPWCYIKEGRSTGISITEAEKFFRERRYSTTFTGGQWTDVYKRLLDGSLDVIANVGWPNSFLEGEPVTASAPYARFNIRIFAKSDESRESSYFLGKRIGVQKGSFAESLIERMGCEPVVFENDIQGMVQLLWKNVDGVATDERVGALYFRESVSR